MPITPSATRLSRLTKNGYPAYLTMAGDAVSERASWENTYARTILQVLRSTQAHTVLAAATPPMWFSIVNAINSRLHLPRDVRLAILMSRSYQQALATLPLEQVAETIARSTATAAYNEHVLDLLRQYGFPVKMWLTRHDAHVREAHRALNGQKKPLAEPFVPPTDPHARLQYPGDSATAPVDLTANCRCVLLGRRR